MADPLPDELTSPPPNGLILIGRDQWDWLTKGLRLLYRAIREQHPTSNQDVLAKLAVITTTLEKLTMATSDFQGSLDRNTAAVQADAASSAAERAQLQAISQQLADALAQLSTSQAPTQAQLDQLNAASSALEASTAADVSDDPAAPAPEG